MQKMIPTIGGSLALAVLINSAGGVSSLNAQTTTQERTAEGGWSGPCESWWDSSDFSFNAMRVCRVTSYLVRSLRPTLDTPGARGLANQLFRICWGNFPKAGADCKVANAWAYPRSWIEAALKGQQFTQNGLPVSLPHPIAMTLAASEILQSDDEVAFVLAHEMGHAVDQSQTSAPSAANEQRADIAAIGFLVNAGYDARSAGRSLQMVSRERGQGAAGNLLFMLFNHLNRAMSNDPHDSTEARISLMKSVYAKGCAALNNRPLGCKEGWK